MPNAPRNIKPSAQIPQITSLSTAFPLTFDSSKSDPAKDCPRSDEKAPSNNRPPHRHDAGH